jgi:WD40 repeat protein
LFVLSKLRAPDLEEVTKTDVRQYPMANSQKNDYFITMCFENDTYYFYDKDGNLLYTYDGFATVNPKDSEFIGNKLVYADFESLHIVDPYEKTAESYDWGNYFNGAYTTVDGVYISKSGKYLAAWDLCNVVVFDVETMEEIYHWNYDYTREGDQYAREAAVTDDGKTVLIIFDDGVIYHVDTQDEELIPYDSKELQVVREQHQFDKMTMSNDGKTAAILCMDEVVRVIDVQSGDVIDSMPLLAQNDLYMEFSDDGRCLLTQGDDLVLRIRDIESKSYIGDFEVGYSISYLIDDDADGLMAVVSSYNIWLLEKETYKVVAETTYTSKGSYFPETNSFLLADSAGIYKIGYKDYKQLLELAEKDFPGLELTPEQKKKYNID